MLRVGKAQLQVDVSPLEVVVELMRLPELVELAEVVPESRPLQKE